MPKLGVWAKISSAYMVVISHFKAK